MIVKPKKSIIASIAKENSWLQYFSWIIFSRKNEIRDYFYVISWTSYKFEWLFLFPFLNRFFCWIMCSLIVVWSNIVFVWVIFVVIWAFLLLFKFFYFWIKRLRIMFEGKNILKTNLMQQFVNSRLKSDVNIGLKLELVITFNISHKICCKIFVKILWI